MGARFRRRVVAGQNNKSFKDLKQHIARLQLDAQNLYGLYAALIQATGTEAQVKQILGLADGKAEGSLAASPSEDSALVGANGGTDPVGQSVISEDK